MFLDNLPRLENLCKYDKVNNVPLSELQRLAAGYGINHVWIVKEIPDAPHMRNPNTDPDQFGQSFILEGCVHIYLKHEMSREEVVRNEKLASWHPEIIEDLEKYIVNDRDAAYFVLLHEIGHAELGHVLGGRTVAINYDELSAKSESYTEEEGDLIGEWIKKRFFNWECKEQFKAANVWALTEFRKLRERRRDYNVMEG